MGVTIPDTPDFGTPVPRATTGVQSYGVTQPIQQDVAAWTYAAQSAKAAADSDAAAMREVGTAVEKWSVSIDTTSAQDALNQLRGKRQELTSGDGGYMRVEGGDVLKKGPDGQTIYDAYPQKLQSSMDEIGGKLQSPRAQKLFQQAAANELLAYKSEVARHGLSQTEKYQGAVYKDTAATLTDRALLSADDPKALEAVVSSLEQATLARAAQLGVPGEAMARGVVSDVYKAVIKRAIDSGDSAKALGAFEAYKGKLDGKDTLALEDQIKTLRTSDTAKTQATEMLSGLPATERAEQGTKQSLQFWTAGGYTQKVSAGITAGFLRESQFSPSAVNPRDGRDGSDSINIGQWNQARATAFKEYARKNGLVPNDMATGLKYAKAEIDGEIPYSVSGLSPDFKARLQNAKTEKEAADIMTRGYFRPKYTEGESAHRQKSASQILAKYGTTDPLRDSVDAATGAVAPKNGPQYIDTRQMLLDADTQYDAATRRNMEVNANNEAQRRATQTQLDLNLATQKRQIETTKLQLDINVDKWMQTGGPNGGAATTRPPPEIWNQLHYEKQKSIDATLVHNAKGTDAVTDQQVWYDLQRGLTSEDPKVREEYANKPLWEYKAKLSNQDFQEIAKMQGTVRKGDPDKQLTHVRNINQMVDDTLLKVGVDTTPKAGSTDSAKALKFRRLVQDKITALEKETGKKSTPEQQQKIVDGLAIDVVTKKGWIWDSTKPRYEMTIKDVPDEEKAKIVDALRRQGYEASDDMIMDLFARKNAKPKP
jgi:hypothetical protein